MSATVLVSGASGFVGSAVVRRLVAGAALNADRFHNDDVLGPIVALIRPGGSPARLDALGRGPHWAIEYCDVADAAAFGAVIARWQPSAVLHLAMDRAAYHDDGPSVRRAAIEIPLETMFAGLAGRTGTRMIYASSAWVLAAGDRLDEHTPLQPTTPYGRNKVHAERLLRVLHERTGVDWLNLRLFNMFGRYESRSRLLPYLVERLSRGEIAALGKADLVRDFTDVDLIADAFAAALRTGKAGCGATYHIGTGRGIAIRDFASTVAAVTGHAELIRFGSVEAPDSGTACQVADPTLAKQVLGWSAGNDQRERIRATARWWLDRRAGEVCPANAETLCPAE